MEEVPAQVILVLQVGSAGAHGREDVLPDGVLEGREGTDLTPRGKLHAGMFSRW